MAVWSLSGDFGISKLVEPAAAGDTVRITRRGKPVAQITAVQTPRKRVVLAGANWS
jgi:antitoxin (DNA-binding transcriptional repressor) of toxin-antitoxin stability system